MLCCVASTSRNITHLQVQQGLRGRGGFPQRQICFKSMSTSCVAKCASFFWMHRLVSKMSADRLISLLQAKLICVSEERGGTWHFWPAYWLLEAVRNTQPSSCKRSKLKGKDSPSWALDGQEMIAPWNVDVKHGHGEAHIDQNEAFEKHCSCTLCVDVLVCVS